MKKLFLLLLSWSVVLVSCKSEKSTEAEPTPKPDTTPVVVIPAPELLTFGFEATNNAVELMDDVACNIDTTNNTITALIPYVTDLDALIPTFTGNFKKVSIGAVTQLSGETAVDFTKEVSYTVTSQDNKTRIYTVTVFCFTGLPIVTIDTDNRTAITSKDDYQKGSISISKTSKYKEAYSGTLKIRGRGNATFGYAKKPYKFKLDTKSELLGMPADKEWALLANYCDKSLLRTSIGFKLAELLGMPWTPRSRFVELFLNGHYDGNYLLTEHVKVSSNRLNINENGYLFERDGYYAQEPLWFTTTHGYNFTFKNPDPETMSTETLDYIKNYMNAFEAALFSDNFKDPEAGYRKYIDVESWAKWYLTHEILCNKDTNPYYFKNDMTDNSKVGMSPVWDFEWSMGIGWNFTGPADPNVLVQRDIYFSRLFQDPYFAKLVSEYYTKARKELIPKLFAFINESAQEIEVSQMYNFKRWNIINTTVSVEAITLGSWANEVQYIKAFLNKRLTSLDKQLASW